MEVAATMQRIADFRGLSLKKSGTYRMAETLDPQISSSIAQDWQLVLPAQVTEEALLDILSAEINQLILHDFPRLLSILYRVDIPESKLRNTLRDNPRADAGRVMAVLILERQREKKKLREMFRQPPGTDEEERW
jgi:hypothetical protein